jgi:long-chain acyl-CoA synthetase
MVVGENRKFPAALVVPAFDAVKDYFRQRGLNFQSDRDLVVNPKVKELIASEIRSLNEHFGHYAQVKKFVLLPVEWSVSTGELTPTLKLKRRHLLSKYADEIESLYGCNEQIGADPQIRENGQHSAETSIAST